MDRADRAVRRKRRYVQCAVRLHLGDGFRHKWFYRRTTTVRSCPGVELPTPLISMLNKSPAWRGGSEAPLIAPETVDPAAIVTVAYGSPFRRNSTVMGAPVGAAPTTA